MSRTADIAEQRRRWRSLRLQYRIGYDDGRTGKPYKPYATRGFNIGYWNGFVEGRARLYKGERRDRQDHVQS